MSLQLSLEGQWPEAALRNEGNEPSSEPACLANPAAAAPVPLATAGAQRGFQITTNVSGWVTFPANLQPLYASPARVVVVSQKNKKGGKKGGERKKNLLLRALLHS